MKNFFMLSLIAIFSIFATGAANAQAGTGPNNTSGLLYVPKNLSQTSRYPLLLVLSPFGDPRSHIKLIAPAAEKHKWIVVGDDCFRNGHFSDSTIAHILQTIQTVKNSYPVDNNKIFSCGLSGGAMGSYTLAQIQPGLIKGIIANTGMMPYGSDPPSNDGPIPANFPRNKYIVMLASPTDFRYQAMKKNRIELERLGWRVYWMEFQGGHIFAPAEYYEAALNWLSQIP